MRILLALLLCVCASLADAQLFSDDFTRDIDPGPLAPWVADSGTWTVTGGTLKGGTNAADSFAFAYVTNSWTDYSVQARVRFSSINADAGGIGGRFNPFSGGHYAAWICPEGSGSGSNILQLLKFQYWLGYEYTNSTWQPMREVSLPSVGTNWHTLKLSFQGNQISVYYDSNLVTSATDTESNPFWTGGICAGMSTANTRYNMFVDDVVVTPLPTALIAVNDSYYVNQNGTLTISGPGVLNNDTPGTNANLTAVKLTNPSKGALTFNSNGSFAYVPSNNFVGVDSFTYQTTDGVSNSLPATVAIDVTPTTNIFYDNFTRTGTGNSFAPWVTGIGEWNIAGGVMLGSGTIQDYYSDAYIPGNVGDFSIQARIQLPSGAWACGLSGRLNSITGERYVANVYPEGSPLGPTPALRLIKFHSWGTWSSSYTAMALVSLPSVGTSTHTLKLAFYGNTIDVYFDGTRVVHAIDNNTDDLPPYRSGAFGAHMYMYTPYQATFDDLTVTALPPFNFPPVLPAQTNLTIVPLANLIVTNTATDTDIPTNTLTYTLTGPSGATIDTNGVITWTPTLAQDSTTNLFTTVVTDFCPGATNAVHLSATNSFVVTVNSQSALVLDSTALLAEGCAPANNAIDPGETVTMQFAIRNTGVVNTTNLVATLLASGGVTLPSAPQNYGILLGGGAAVAQPFTFTAAGSCGGTITASLQLQDGPQYVGTVTVPITLGQITTLYTQAFDTVTAPALPSGWTTAASGAETTWVTQTITNRTAPNSAFCPDASNIGTSDLISPSIILPAGPAILSFAHFYDLETNSASTTDGFDGGVVDIKIGANAFADILAVGGSFAANGYDHTIDSGFGNPLGGRQGWSGTSPGFVTTIVNLPVSAQNQSVQFRWRCGTDNSNGRTGWRIDSVGVSGRACCANTAPFLAAQSDRSIAELTSLVVTNTATDPGAPPGSLSYSLVNPPVGASIDANGIITWSPSESQGPSTNTLTTVVSDGGLPPLSATNSFKVVVNEINVAPVLPPQTNRTIVALTSLIVTNTATDSDVPVNPISYSLITGPTNAIISNAGVISWTPVVAQVPSTNLFTTVATDSNLYAVNSQHLTATNSFTVVVTAIHNGPTLAAQTNRSINEQTLLVVTNGATDTDIPARKLTYTLLNPPSGAAIDTNGVITWTPSELQGPATNTITTVVTDDGTPQLSATNSLTVTVYEINVAPILPIQADRTIAGITPLIVTNTATDSDVPTNLLSYSLDGPTNAVINSNGVISWTPATAQVPSTNLFTTVVTDFNPSAVNAQHLSASNSFTVIVNPIHNGPVLGVQTNRTINELSTLLVTNTAADTDLPARKLTYELLDPPPGAAIDTNGVISWTPTESQGPSTNTIATIVTDDGIPELSATNTFTVIVQELNVPPVLPAQADRTINGLTPLTVTNTATDSDLPANVLAYSLIEAPANALIDAGGVITWSPTVAQVPSTNIFTTVVTDSNPWAVNAQHLSATNSFTVVVNAIHNGPQLSLQTNQIVAELTTLVVTNAAVDSDVPSHSLTYHLLDAPVGATIETNGVISWTPTEVQGPSTNTVTTVVFDDGTPSLSSTNSFTVIVEEINSAPVLPPQSSLTITGLTAVTVTNTATDSDQPVNTLAYFLLEAPTNAAIDSDGVISWTPTIAQVPSTNVFTTIVTDFNPWAINSHQLSATNSFVVIVNPIHKGPILPIQTNVTLTEPTTLIVTNTAADHDIPTLSLTYQLMHPPAGAAIDSNGVITWTPTEAEAPSTNTFETIVADEPNGPALTATNSFVVIVLPPILAPVFESISVANGNVTLIWSSVNGRNYRLQYSEDLSGTNWTDITPDVTASGPTATLTSPEGEAIQRYYRVFLLP